MGCPGMIGLKKQAGQIRVNNHNRYFSGGFVIWAMVQSDFESFEKLYFVDFQMLFLKILSIHYYTFIFLKTTIEDIWNDSLNVYRSKLGCTKTVHLFFVLNLLNCLRFLGPQIRSDGSGSWSSTINIRFFIEIKMLVFRYFSLVDQD